MLLFQLILLWERYLVFSLLAASKKILPSPMLWLDVSFGSTLTKRQTQFSGNDPIEI